LLEERASAMESWADELDGVDEPEDVTNEDIEEEKENNGDEYETDEDVRSALEDQRFEEFKSACTDCSHGL